MSFKKLFTVKLFIIFNFIINQCAFADNHNIYETLESIQKNIKTLEKAVYSGSIEINNESGSSSILNDNSEDVLTKHLLKLSEIENQFQELTNRFEEINFKLDKLSNRLSKVQADNQIRFQDIEGSITSGDFSNKISKKKLNDNDNPPKLIVQFFEEQKNIKNINCYSNDGGNWKKSDLQFNDSTMTITFKQPFIPRRGRINCSLNDDGVWRWFGTQFTIRPN